jgi:hypothetical protein
MTIDLSRVSLEGFDTLPEEATDPSPKRPDPTPQAEWRRIGRDEFRSLRMGDVSGLDWPFGPLPSVHGTFLRVNTFFRVRIHGVDYVLDFRSLRGRSLDQQFPKLIGH